jgi:hypothetical protein
MKVRFPQIVYNSKVLAVALLFATSLFTQAGPIRVIGPYVLKVFARGPAGSTQPDSITIDDHFHIWVSFTNGVKPDGSDGKSSTVIEYDHNGTILHTYSVLGSNDGLKFNPDDRTIWALRNQDGNPALTIINPENQTQAHYTFAARPTHGGGFDDVVFLNDKIYFSASNPTLDANGNNPAPSIVSIRLVGNTIDTNRILSGDAYAFNVATKLPVKTVQTDPDSMTVDTLGNLVLDSQADSILLFISNPGTYAQSVVEVPLADASGKPVTVDDTVFPTRSAGRIYFTDSGTNTIYVLLSHSFDTRKGYSSSGPSIGTISLRTGLYTPIVVGLSSSHGAIFVPARIDLKDLNEDQNEDQDEEDEDYSFP